MGRGTRLQDVERQDARLYHVVGRGTRLYIVMGRQAQEFPQDTIHVSYTVKLYKTNVYITDLPYNESTFSDFP